MVRHHWSARCGQDHGAGQFRSEISAGAGDDPGSGRGRRRHALLRLVVHGRGRPDRYGGTLYDADSDAKSDKESWFSFLDLLKKNRPRQPINGVLVAISVEDILTMSRQDLAAHAEAIRMRLLELHQRLKVSFPVYALFTKVDLVAGFAEYFSYLNEAARRQVWGATFQTADKTQNLIGDIPDEFDLLLERLSEETLDRLQDEPAPQHRAPVVRLRGANGAR